MNHNEIEACVVRAKNGSTADTLMLLNQFKPYIFKSAGQLRLKHYDTNDLVQIGYASIINAIKKYKLGSNTFSCYAVHSIANALKSTTRQSRRYESELALNNPITSDGDSDTEFIDLLKSPDNPEEDVLDSISILELKEALSKLQADEIELLTYVYFNKETIKNYARKKGLSYTSLLRKNKYILEKLKRCLAE